jgi:hypothetical protein
VLAVGGRGEEPIDQLLVGIRRRIFEERIDVGQRGRQPVSTSVTRLISVSLSASGEKLQAVLLQPAEDESIDLRELAAPGDERGRHRSGGRDERPVRLVLRAFGDPPAERVDRVRRERLVRLERRHPQRGGRVRDARDQLALVRAARNDRAAPLCWFSTRVAAVGLIEAQAGAARLLVGAVTLEAVLGQDRPDVPVVVDRVRRDLTADGRGLLRRRPREHTREHHGGSGNETAHA